MASDPTALADALEEIGYTADHRVRQVSAARVNRYLDVVTSAKLEPLPMTEYKAAVFLASLRKAAYVTADNYFEDTLS